MNYLYAFAALCVAILHMHAQPNPGWDPTTLLFMATLRPYLHTRKMQVEEKEKIAPSATFVASGRFVRSQQRPPIIVSRL